MKRVEKEMEKKKYILSFFTKGEAGEQILWENVFIPGRAWACSALEVSFVNTEACIVSLAETGVGVLCTMS